MLVNESLQSFKRGQSVKSALNVGIIERAMKWLKDKQTSEIDWRPDIPKNNFNFKFDQKKREIIITGIDVYELMALEIPEYVVKSLTDRMKFLIGISSSSDYDEYAIKVIDEGYIPPASIIYKEFHWIRKTIGEDRLLKLLVDRFGSHIPANLTMSLQYVWTNEILKQYFDNPEFKEDDELRNRDPRVIQNDRQQAWEMLAPHFFDITSPRQLKNQTLAVDDGIGEYIMTRGGRLRKKGDKVDLYANNYTTFKKMAEVILQKIGHDNLRESTTNFERGLDTKKGLDIGTKSSHFWPKKYEELTEEEKEQALFNYREYYENIDAASDIILGDEFLLEPAHKWLVQVFGNNPYSKIKSEPMIGFDPGRLYFDINHRTLNLQNSIQINDEHAFLKFLGFSDPLIEEIWYEIGEDYIEFEPNDSDYEFSIDDEAEIKDATHIFDKYINDLKTEISDQYEYVFSEENLIKEMGELGIEFDSDLNIVFN